METLKDIYSCITLRPPGTIVVMEDIDVGMPASNGAMTRGDDDDDEDLEDDKQLGSSRSKKSVKPKGGGVTLSGLLNAIVS